MLAVFCANHYFCKCRNKYWKYRRQMSILSLLTFVEIYLMKFYAIRKIILRYNIQTVPLPDVVQLQENGLILLLKWPRHTKTGKLIASNAFVRKISSLFLNFIIFMHKHSDMLYTLEIANFNKSEKKTSHFQILTTASSTALHFKVCSWTFR